MLEKRWVRQLKEGIIEKFCRECYTTTPHKIIEVLDSKNNRKYEKAICTKCYKTLAYKRSKPKRSEKHEDFLDV